MRKQNTLPPSDPYALTKARRAVDQLLWAYAAGAIADGVKWEHLDEAFGLAKQAMPGRYEQLVEQIERGHEFLDDVAGAGDTTEEAEASLASELRQRVEADPTPERRQKAQGSGLSSRVRKNRVRIGMAELP